MLAFFHRPGKVLELRLRLKRKQMFAAMAAASFLMTDPGMPSWPVAVLALVLLSAFSTASRETLLKEKLSAPSQLLVLSMGASVAE
jgi:hypothetical protein